MDKVIGLDIGGTSIKAGIVTESGKIISLAVVPTEAEQGRNHVLGQCVKAVTDLAGYQDCIRLGTGSPGCIDPESGTVVAATKNLPDWPGTNVKAILEDKLGLKVRADNDVNAAAFGEYCFGAGREAKLFAFIAVGTGIGGGIVIDGKILHGETFYAGGFGHIPINPDGEVWTSGLQGTVESLSSSMAIIKRFVTGLSGPGSHLADFYNKNKSGFGVQQIAGLAADGDEFCIGLISDAGRSLGIALAATINVLAPDILAVGGGVAEAGKLLWDPMLAEVRNRVISYKSRKVRVEPAELGTDAGIIGSASLWLRG
jgi:glucokinase